MDKSKMMDAMKASISEVLEQMFFLPVDFSVPDATPSELEAEQASIIAKLEFSGSPGGIFLLRVPAALAHSVSADFLGIPPPNLADDQVAGTILEMANMLAGSTLSTYDPHALFDLQIPQLIQDQDESAMAGDIPDRIIIRIQTPESRMTFQLIT